MKPICYSMKGSLHDEVNVPNQDAVQVFQHKGYYGAVVCDGVSLKSDRTFSQSQIASNICTKCAVDYLMEKLQAHQNTDEMLKLIEETFTYSLQMLNSVLKKLGIAFHDCQTTMIVMILKKGNLYSGIAGDGGIVYQTRSGELGTMVTRWKTSPEVYPIGEPSQWKFFACDNMEDPVVKAMAATDGVFDDLLHFENDQVLVNYEELDKFFNLTRLPRKRRDKAFARLVQALPSTDDKSAAILCDHRAEQTR